MGPGAAETAARALIESGCGGLISFGLAGALDPGLQRGSLVIAEEVVSARGERFPTGRDWRERLLGRLAPVDRPLSGGRLYGSDEPVLTAEGKRSLAAHTGASVTDMESHAVARVARDERVPLLVVRAVLDPARESIPGWLPRVVDARGRPRIAEVAR